MTEKMNIPCCGLTEVIRLKELPHVYGTDFDLFRCAGCGKTWVAAFVSAGAANDWEPVNDGDVQKMMTLPEPELRLFMREWAKSFS